VILVRLRTNLAAPAVAGWPGDVLALEPAVARALIAGGYAEPAGPAGAEQATAPPPAETAALAARQTRQGRQRRG
jgi:hypothetical protein